MCRVTRGLSLSLALALLAGPRCLLAQREKTLEPGSSVERTLAPGVVHRYDLALVSGQFVHLELEQNHLDIVIRVLSPAGAALAESDNVADEEDPLSLSFLTASDGIHRAEIRLRGRKTTPGVYRLTVEQPRPPTTDDGKRVAAERLLYEADHLLAIGSAEALKEALARYEKVLTSWREIADRREEASTLSRLTDALGAAGDLRQALVRGEEMLALWKQLGDRRGEAAALTRVGLAHSELGDQRRAIEYLEQSLAMRREDRNLRGQAEALNDIAVALGAMGEKPEAIARYTDALKLASAAGWDSAEVMILKNRAVDYVGIGETDRALTDLREALKRFRDFGQPQYEGSTLYHIGEIYLDRSEVSEALRHYRLALVFLRRTGDKRFEGLTWDHVGLAHLASHQPQVALHDFERARELLHACQDQRAEAMVLANIGRAYLEQGEPVEARDRLAQALALVQASGDRVHEATALVHLARAERALGNLEASRARLEEALRLTESLRGSIPGAGERASYMAKTRDRYDLLIEILMDLDKKEPGRGWDAEALLASERAKARSLVELLAQARIDLRQGIDEGLLAQERSLESQIETARREEQRKLAGAAVSAVSPDSERRSLDSLLVEYENVEARVRAASPRFAALARPRPLGLKEIREQVLDADTMLVEYALGEKRSFVWVATPDRLITRELPSRGVVEEAARRLYRAWSGGNALPEAEVGRRARALSRALLGPVADQFAHDRKRLAIVAEGALQFIPFAALPLPGDPTRAPLVSRHEIVMLPSATTMAVLRQETTGRGAPERHVAVLADPVFDRSDSRVSARTGRAVRREPVAAGTAALTRSIHESGLQRLERLTGTRREADEIAALAGPQGSLEALDFQASRATALGPEVARSRIIHFASHGLLNTRHPELSGIVLSMVDEYGHPIDGFLQTRDLYEMHLSADLVVLSACQTALGKDVRGEGLLGLSRGFMYAGVPRIVASLWRVPDRATAELMKRFYRGILVERLRPAAALRAAQNAIRKEKLWSSPYSWAAFTLQGDWN